jgi:hypothetical protein
MSCRGVLKKTIEGGLMREEANISAKTMKK